MLKRVSSEEWFPIFEVNKKDERGEFLIEFSPVEIAQIELAFREFELAQTLIREKLRKAGKTW